MSALLLARGIAGPTGKIVLGDSESGRGSIYADVIPGGYETFDITPPFTPAVYIAALDAVENSGATVGIVDSGSHEWEGLGGVLEMAGESESANGKSLNNWRIPKMEHAKFIQRLLRCSIPMIICLRAKYKTRQTKDAATGKKIVTKDEVTSPIQAEDFIFEATCHAEILPRHNINLTKGGHPTLAECFPTIDQGPLTVEHGAAIAKWCANAGGGKRASSDSAEMRTAKKKLFAVTEKIHSGDPAKLLQWLVDEALLPPEATLDTLSLPLILATIPKAERKLA